MDLHQIILENIPWEPGAKRSCARRSPATAQQSLCTSSCRSTSRSRMPTATSRSSTSSRRIRFPSGEKSVVLGPGVLHFSPDVVHWGEVVGDEPVLILDIFTPVREGYAQRLGVTSHRPLHSSSASAGLKGNGRCPTWLLSDPARTLPRRSPASAPIPARRTSAASPRAPCDWRSRHRATCSDP